MPPLRWLFLVLCAVVAVRAADDSLIGSFKTMFFGNEPEKTNDSATSSQNNPPISYHQYATASSPCKWFCRFRIVTILGPGTIGTVGVRKFLKFSDSAELG